MSTDAEPLRLMAVMAHPDDESLGIGGTLAAYAAQGIETFVVTATRGERGRFFSGENRPSDAEVGRVREAELRAATQELGVREVALLGYMDGALDHGDHREVVDRIAGHIRRVRPQVVITFDPFGAYGHVDHVAISQYTAAAVHQAASANLSADEPPHSVSKLYYFVTHARRWAAYQSAFKQLTSSVDGETRGTVAWPEWGMSAEIDTRSECPTVWRAVCHHKTQLTVYARLGELTQAQHEMLWGSGTFYRVFSTVNGGRALEDDLFVGLR